MSQLKLYCFGPPRLERDGNPVEVSLRKSMALLIYLAVTKQPHTRDALAALFWPEEEPRASRGRLRRILYDLNRVLGEGYFLVSGETLQRNLQADLWLDTEEFQKSITECLTSDTMEEDFTPGCLELLTQAVEQFSGEFLAGFTLPDCPLFDEWQFFEGETLQRLLTRALVSLTHAYRNRGEWEQAVGFARRWLALDPLHEPAHRCLMELYAGSEQYSAALRQYEICVQTLDRELGVSPEPETTALYEQIRTRSRVSSSPMKTDGHPLDGTQAGQTLPSETKPKYSLPSHLTPTVGRREELVEIHRLLIDPGTRLLSLTGPGGIGKTRLAIEAAAALLKDDPLIFPDGVYFVPLAPLSSPEGVLPAIARSINFSFSKDGDNPTQQILDHLRPKRMLLLLDNFEHLIEDGSLHRPIQILAAAPGLKILVTSRTRLNVQGEQLFQVSGLRIPELPPPNQGQILDEAEIEDSAVSLFLQSARRVKAGFQLSADNLSHILRICQLLQGMPLGIELASAWMEVLSPAEIAAEIVNSLDFLEAGWQDIPERQRSLRAVFEASWKLLTPLEREVFQTLSIFRGGFTRQAAQAITGASLKVLLALVHKSWLEQNEYGRFQVHELLRQYAEAYLRSDPNVWHKAQDRHSAYYASFVKEQGERMKGSDQKEAFETVACDFENIRAAWRWLVEGKQVEKIRDMLFGLYRFAMARSMDFQLLPEVQVATLAFRESEGSVDQQALLASLLTLVAQLHRERMGIPFGVDKEVIRMAWELASRTGVEERMGFWSVLLAERYAWGVDPDLGLQKLQNMLPRIRQQEDAWTLAFTLTELGALQRTLHRLDEAQTYLAEALSLHRQAGTYDAWSSTLRALGRVAIEQGSYGEAERILVSAQELAEKSGDPVEKILNLWEISDLRINEGRVEEAFQAYRDIRQVATQAGIPHMAAASFSYESINRSRYGEIEQAMECRVQSLAISEKMGDPNGIAWSHWEMGEIHRLSGDLEQARRWYTDAFKLFQEHNVDIGIAFYYRGLGDIAQAQGDFIESQRSFQASLMHAQDANFDWSVSYALSGLGRAALGLGQIDLAQKSFRQALEMARRIGNRGLAMVALTGLAKVSAETGEARQALGLSTFVLNQPATWLETRADASKVLEAAASALPHAAAVEAQASGAAPAFDVFLNDLLAAQ